MPASLPASHSLDCWGWPIPKGASKIAWLRWGGQWLQWTPSVAFKQETGLQSQGGDFHNEKSQYLTATLLISRTNLTKDITYFLSFNLPNPFALRTFIFIWSVGNSSSGTCLAPELGSSPAGNQTWLAYISASVAILHYFVLYQCTGLAFTFLESYLAHVSALHTVMMC